MAWIAAYKIIKAVIAISGGVILLRLGRENLVHVAHRWLRRLWLDPEGRFGTLILNRVAHFDPGRLHDLALIFFGYTLLYCVEAFGLLREKRWAEWLTVVQTLILIPMEIYEIIHRPGPIKILALSLSLAVVFYLVWRIHRDDLEEKLARNY